jgi:hypothetical protein
MAGILDELMDGIAAKEKQGGQTPPATTPSAPGQTPPPAEGTDKPLHTYSDDFKKQYGDRNGKKDEKKADDKKTA